MLIPLTVQLNQGEHYDYEPSWAGIQNGEGNDDEAWFVVMSKLDCRQVFGTSGYCCPADVAGLAGYDTFGANASGIDWLGNAEKAHYMMSRYWANSTSETDCLCGGGCVFFNVCSRATEADGLQSEVAARRKLI
jgi:hypothetical protein